MGLIDRFLKAAPAVAKAGAFLHLVEDNLAHISITGISSWITTYGTLHATLSQLDWHTQAAAVGANATALVAHTIKRGQTLSANQAPADPPWKGEAD